MDDPRLVAAEEDLRRAIGARKSTDVIIEPWWAVAPLILTLVGAIAGVATMLARMRSLTSDSDWADAMAGMRDGFLVVIVFSVLSIAVLALITYMLVKRRNDHFSREDEVRTALVQLIRSAAWSKERSDFVFPELRMIDQYVGYEPRRDPLLWSLAIALGGLSIFGVLPFFFVSDPSASIGIIFLSIGLAALIGFISFVLTIYMFYWLGKDIKEHDTRWGIFSSSARIAMSKLGFPYPNTLGYGTTELPERSFALYLILTLFVSPFVYYWWYTLIKDPNDHFRSQWVFEDELLATMKVQRHP